MMKFQVVLAYIIVCSATKSDAYSYSVINENFSPNESCVMCLTLNELSSFKHLDRIQLVFHPGQHKLNRSTFLLFEEISEVSINGNVDPTEIICGDNSGIMLLEVGFLTMSNISLVNCGGSLPSRYAADFKMAAVFLHSVPNVQLEGVILVQSTHVGLFMSQLYGTTRIYNSVVRGSQLANIVCMWAANNRSGNSFHFIAEGVTIANGRPLHPQNFKDDISGGMNIFISKAEVVGTILLYDNYFLNNSGVSGGNLKMNISQCYSNTSLLNITIASSLISQGKAVMGAGVSFTDLCDLHPQHDYGTRHHRLTMTHTNISNNHALVVGGGMNIHVHESSCTEVNMAYTNLVSNSVSSNPSVEKSRYLFIGGGLNFQYQIISTDHSVLHHSYLEVIHCGFYNNSAYSGAGVYISVVGTGGRPHYATNAKSIVDIMATEIVSNQGYHGAGMVFKALTHKSDLQYLISVKLSTIANNMAHVQASGLLISLPSLSGNSIEFHLCDMTFTNNFVANSGSYAQPGFPSTLSLHSVSKLSLRNVSFYHNSGSGIGALFSRVSVSGCLNFFHITAPVGSGVNLISSSLDITNATLISFELNHAKEVGGAIYTSIFPQHEAYCFYSMKEATMTNATKFQFINNSANIGGSI